MATDTRPDAELVTAWAAGDQSAFAAVYDRYADALYGFALARLRDRAAAADAVQDTFLRAARRVDQLRDRTRLRAWLYAIARNQVIDAVRKPALLATTELDDMIADEPDLADVAAAGEAAALLRDAALGLNERDRELLDLHLRHGLDGADLADVAGLTRPQSYVAMNRLRARLAKAVGIVLVARHGSRDCAGLAEVLRGWDGRFTLDVRSRVTRHVERCDECSRRRTTLVAAVQLSPGVLGLPLLVAPALLRDTTIDRVAAERAGAQPPAGGDVVPVGPAATWRRDGFPVAPRAAGHRRAAALLGAAAVIVALVTGVVIARRDDGAAAGGAPVVASAPPVTTGPAATATTSPPPTTLGTTTTAAATTTTASTSTTVVETSSTVAESLPAAPGPSEPGIAAPRAGTTAPDQPPAAGDAGEADEAAPPAGDEPAPDDPPQPPATTPPVDTTVPAAPPPPPPPAAGHIAVLSGPIDLGSAASGGTIRIRNEGGQPTGWTAATGNGAFGVGPAAGSLEPGQEVDLAVTVDRSALAEGSHATVVTIGAEHGGGPVNVAARVERDPVITAFARTPPVVRTSGSCGPTLVSVAVTPTDESPIGSVAVQWSSDGMFAQLTNLTPNGGGGYSGQVGGFTSPGAHSLKAIVTDNRGNSASQTTSVTVIAC